MITASTIARIRLRRRVLMSSCSRNMLTLFLEYSNPNAAPLPAAERASVQSSVELRHFVQKQCDLWMAHPEHVALPSFLCDSTVNDFISDATAELGIHIRNEWATVRNARRSFSEKESDFRSHVIAFGKTGKCRVCRSGGEVLERRYILVADHSIRCESSAQVLCDRVRYGEVVLIRERGT